MTKYEFIKQAFIASKIPLVSTKGIDYVLMSCEGFRIAECDSIVVTKFNKCYLPHKPKGLRASVYILSLYGFNCCTKCEFIKDISEFLKDRGNICKECTRAKQRKYQKENSRKNNASSAKYNAAKINRTPSWANSEAIYFWYECCPAGCHVDHIIPLQGNNISGLHIETNLQWLPAKQNLEKSNKWPNDKI